MAGSGGKWGGRVIRVVSWLVPRSRRPEWREEWESELWHLRRVGGSQDGYRGEPERSGTGSTFRFVAGAVRDAASEFSQRWSKPVESGEVMEREERRVRGHVLEDLVSDVRFGLRTLARSPAFAAIAILTIGLGIGANTAVFSVVNGVILRPLPYPEPERVLHVGWDWNGNGSVMGAMSPFKFTWLREQTRAFESLATWRTGTPSLGPRGEDGAVTAVRVSDDFFRVIGFQPLLGRAFTAEEQSPGGPAVAILSNALWRTRFGGDPSVIGSEIVLDGASWSVVGVMPPDFAFPELATDVGVIEPLALRPDPREMGANYPVLGRLAPGVTRAAAAQDVERVFDQLRAARPEQFSNEGERGGLIGYRDLYLGDLQRTLWVLLGAVVLVLLVACTNVANLLLARGTVRRREMALRATLGASRWRIARQVLSEGLVLSVLGGVVGLGVGWAGLRALVGLAPAGIVRLGGVRIDGGVLIFTAVVSVLTGVVFGLIAAFPAWRVDLASAVKAGQRAGMMNPRGVRGRDLLIGVEAALAMMLLAGAGLLIASFVRLRQTDLGFDARQIVTLSFPRTPAELSDPSVALGFERQLLERLDALPFVTSAASASILPFDHHGLNIPMTVEGDPDASEGAIEWRSVSRGYFDVLGLTLVRGRGFSEADVTADRPVMIVSESLAQRYFPDSDPLGQRIRLGAYRGESIPGFDDPPREIVGVVADMRELGPTEAPRRTIFTPQTQSALLGMPTFLIRTRGAVSADALRGTVAETDPRMPVPVLGSLDERLGERLAQDRFNTLLMSLFAGAALLLTAIGIYGVVSWMVRQRTTEIGIRMALGAARGSVLRRAILRGMIPVLVGLAAGVVGAIALTRLLSTMLHGLSATDPVTFLAVATVLALVGFVACWIPARRAATVDPVVALRFE